MVKIWIMAQGRLVPIGARRAVMARTLSRIVAREQAPRWPRAAEPGDAHLTGTCHYCQRATSARLEIDCEPPVPARVLAICGPCYRRHWEGLSCPGVMTYYPQLGE